MTSPTASPISRTLGGCPARASASRELEHLPLPGREPGGPATPASGSGRRGGWLGVGHGAEVPITRRGKHRSLFVLTSNRRSSTVAVSLPCVIVSSARPSFQSTDSWRVLQLEPATSTRRSRYPSCQRTMRLIEVRSSVPPPTARSHPACRLSTPARLAGWSAWASCWRSFVRGDAPGPSPPRASPARALVVAQPGDSLWSVARRAAPGTTWRHRRCAGAQPPDEHHRAGQEIASHP